MKQISVHIKDKHTLVLDEDAQQGDYIDLKNITSFDSSGIEHAIAVGSDQLYERKKVELKEQFELEKQQAMQHIKQEYQEKINEIRNQINVLEQEKEFALRDAASKHQLELQKQQQNFQLKIQEFEQFKKNTASKEEQLKQQLSVQWHDQISQLEQQLAILRNDSVYQKNLFEAEKQKWNLEKNHELAELKNQYEKNNQHLQAELEKQRLEYENQIQTIQRQKASLNVKQTGEDLEAWCDNEVKSYMQNGLSNCVWAKDNLVVRDEGESKGSKADYLFKIYADEQHLPEDLLASICLDMKDENPDSINKKKNADYFSMLDKNRIKKNCKYAVLVSNLEADKANDLPIFKVTDYPDMYVVRPAYLMTFLNMIASLTTRFKKLILQQAKDDLKIKDKMALLQEFEDLKNTYLDKPLAALEKDLDDILRQNDAISKAARKIEDSCIHMKNQYINSIADKLSKFERKLR